MVSQVGGSFSTASVMIGTTAGNIEGNSIPNMQGQEEKKQVITQAYPKEQVEKIVSSMNDFLKASPNTNLKFEFHDKLNEYYVTIIDEVTKEIVREIPPKKMLDMFAAMTEFLGLMVDKKI
ncbi:flagellar protein FlaG [Lederbergia citrea]|uniref:Flagellar protein FlaG n=1 Tax=Lederbergia citrea TaxID=2833581 RepID=A0A942Z417_9BACI|nr:flagellar protein FlaG [Lederbergia citrea]MBS4178300.1 flagellar protein FlaG [Lederbergia citrea]MBS4204976.1 flagellar protein FlaG [Lederbergia citrea]MBS4223169.1 flagellar protein FlaG [Lederbergia citrea]